MKLLVLLLSFSLPAAAGPRSLYLTNTWRWAGHHKAFLASQAIMLTATTLDVESTLAADRAPCRCLVEANPLFPNHAGRARLWLPALVDVPLVVGDYWIDKRFGHRYVWIAPVVVAVPQFVAAGRNWSLIH